MDDELAIDWMKRYCTGELIEEMTRLPTPVMASSAPRGQLVPPTTRTLRIGQDGSRGAGDLGLARWHHEWSILSLDGDFEVEGVGDGDFEVCQAPEIWSCWASCCPVLVSNL
jgi:hypothetical protein